MTPDQNLLNLQQKEAAAPKRFDPRSATPFVNKSVSEETRRAYRRAVADFFQFVGGKHPTQVGPSDVICWRDHLRHSRKRAATVSFKLSVIRSFFEYLKLAESLRSILPRQSWSHLLNYLQNHLGVRSVLKRFDIFSLDPTVRSLKGREIMP